MARTNAGIWKNIIIPIVVALIALPIGIGIEMYKSSGELQKVHAENEAALARQEREFEEKRQEKADADKENECLRRAAYLDEMATSLQSMIDEFKKGRAPKESGAAFNYELTAFGDPSQAVLGKDRWQKQVLSLRQVSYDAKHELDPANGQTFIPWDEKERIERWVGNALETKGQLKAKAAELRAHFGNCDLTPATK